MKDRSAVNAFGKRADDEERFSLFRVWSIFINFLIVILVSVFFFKLPSMLPREYSINRVKFGFTIKGKCQKNNHGLMVKSNYQV